MNDEHRETYKGHTVRIVRDESASSPDEWKDTNLFAVAFSQRHFWLERDGFDRDAFEDERRLDIDNRYHVFALFAHIHSGIHLWIDGERGVDCQWDSGQIGFVLVSKTEWPDATSARAAATGLKNDWNHYLSGDVWGYIVEYDDEHVDSCWGFIGDISYALTEARAGVDRNVQALRAKHVARIKRWVKYRVPLSRRTPCPC